MTRLASAAPRARTGSTAARRLAPALLAAALSCAAPGIDPALPVDAGPTPQLLGSRLPFRAIALTYDDGPDEHTLELAQWLHDQGIAATFFVTGCNLHGHPVDHCSLKGGRHDFDPAILGQLVALGHRVGNHTEHHFDLVRGHADDQTIVDEFRRTQVALEPFIRDGVRLFRPPHNSWNATVAQALAQTPDLASLVGPFKYDDAGGDWGCTDPTIFHPPLTPEQCVNEYLKVQAFRQNGIFQMHDRNPNAVGSRYALEFTQALLARLRSEPGATFRFVPLDAIPGITGALQFKDLALRSPWYSDDLLRDVDVVTLRLADVDGDGRADACVRDVAGVWCTPSHGRDQMGMRHLWTSALGDSKPFAPRGVEALLLGDVDGDHRADLCVRAKDGLHCFRSTGHRFLPAWFSPAFADSAGWTDDPSYFRSLSLGDVDGDGHADVCGRDGHGVLCVRFASGRFLLPERWSTDFADGWQTPGTGDTLQLADIDGDHRADACARGPDGIVCALSTGRAFAPAAGMSDLLFSDRQGWNADPSYARSVRFADIDGDGRADVCGRTADGVACALSDDGKRFDRYHYVINTDLSDATGWAPERYGATLQLGDVDGDQHADLCARGVKGLVCAFAPR